MLNASGSLIMTPYFTFVPSTSLILDTTQDTFKSSHDIVFGKMKVGFNAADKVLAAFSENHV